VSLPFAYIGFYLIIVAALIVAAAGVAVGRRFGLVSLGGLGFAAVCAAVGAVLGERVPTSVKTGVGAATVALFGVAVGALVRNVNARE
jgi:hypothetical protein